MHMYAGMYPCSHVHAGAPAWSPEAVILQEPYALVLEAAPLAGTWAC